MERMHEIMKERLEADEALSLFLEARQNTLDRLDQEMAFAGPIKIGDVVVANDCSRAGTKIIIDRLWISNDQSLLRGRYGVRAKGRVLKKDGTPGLLMAEYFIEVGVAP